MKSAGSRWWTVRSTAWKLAKALRHPAMFRYFLLDSVARKLKGVGDGSRALMPRVVKFYINTRCNARCVMCDVGQRNRHSVFYRQMTAGERNLMSPDDWASLSDQLADFRPEIHMHGVEPLLHPDLFGIVERIRSRGLYLYLVTNGILLPEKAHGLIAGDINKICVSVDGPPAIHDRIRGAGTFQKAREGIDKLLSYRGKMGKKTKIKTNFTINPWNYLHMSEYASLMLEDVGVDYVTFIHPYYVERRAAERHNSEYGYLGKASAVNLGQLDPSRIDAARLWNQIQRVKSEFPPHRVFFHCDVTRPALLDHLYRHTDQPLPGASCIVPWYSTTVLANGDMIINNRCFEYVAGNVRSTPFADIWRGERYQIFRRALKKAGYFPACLRCCGMHPPSI